MHTEGCGGNQYAYGWGRWARGRTILVLENEGGCAWDVEVDGKKIENPKRITIVMYGDDEAERFVEALEFAVKVLRMQIDSRNEKGYEIEVE